MTLNKRITQLENQVVMLQSKIQDLVDNIEEKYSKPLSKVGNPITQSLIRPIDVSSGLGNVYGGNILWNSAEVIVPPFNAEPTNPEDIVNCKSYNKHTHSRYTGGALIKDVLEIVEYDWDSVSPAITNKHSQEYWQNQPRIKTEENSNNENIDKIGLLDLIFNPDTKTWGVAAYEIDVEKCYLVKRDKNGEIETDSKGQEMKSPLYNEDTTKTSVVWDSSARVWRFLAVYASGE